MVFLYFSTFQNQELPMRWSILLRVLGFLYFENADNTLCWLFGRIHKAKCNTDIFKRGCNTIQISTHHVSTFTTASTHSTLSNTTSTTLFYEKRWHYCQSELTFSFIHKQIHCHCNIIRPLLISLLSLLHSVTTSTTTARMWHSHSTHFQYYYTALLTSLFNGLCCALLFFLSGEAIEAPAWS